MIRVKVINISLSHLGFVVILGDDPKGKTLPIFIGAPEAQAIAVILNGVQTPRPMTHDLTANILRSMGCQVAKVVISDLLDNTFYARVFFEFMENPSQNFDIDARPSDAIAMALRFDAQIFVAKKIMDEAGVVPEASEEVPARKEQEEPTQIEALQKRLQHAIKEERYEQAAKIRDEINDLQNKIEPN